MLNTIAFFNILAVISFAIHFFLRFRMLDFIKAHGLFARFDAPSLLNFSDGFSNELYARRNELPLRMVRTAILFFYFSRVFFVVFMAVAGTVLLTSDSV